VGSCGLGSCDLGERRVANFRKHNDESLVSVKVVEFVD
jgi:hypothetical protein